MDADGLSQRVLVYPVLCSGCAGVKPKAIKTSFDPHSLPTHTDKEKAPWLRFKFFLNDNKCTFIYAFGLKTSYLFCVPCNGQVIFWRRCSWCAWNISRYSVQAMQFPLQRIWTSLWRNSVILIWAKEKQRGLVLGNGTWVSWKKVTCDCRSENKFTSGIIS